MIAKSLHLLSLTYREDYRRKMEINTKYIFISYSRKDRRIVNKVVSLLREKGFNLWIDTTGIESGEQFKHKIVNAIEGCEVFLYFASKNSNVSPWTAKEIGVATSLNKRIIPIRLDHSPFNKEVLFDIVNINYIDISNIRTRESNINELVAGLGEICPVDKLKLTPIEEHDKKTRINHLPGYNLRQVLSFRKLYKTVFDKISAFSQMTLDSKVKSCFNALKSKKFWLCVVSLMIAYALMVGIYRLNIYIRYACVTEQKIIDVANKGNILSHDGRVLATYEPKYDIHLDCTIIDNDIVDDQKSSLFAGPLYERFRRSLFAHKFRKFKMKRDTIDITPAQAYSIVKQHDNFFMEDYGDAHREDSALLSRQNCQWRANAKALSLELSNLFLDKSANEYYSSFCEGRRKGRKYVKICEGVDMVICDTISRMPLLRKGQFGGGLIITNSYKRKYQYGDIAKRTLGYSEHGNKVGIDGTFDSILQGVDGEKLVKKVNFRGICRDEITKESPKIDGADIRTTLSIEMQQTVDDVLRQHVKNDTTIYGGTVVIMDVKTGAIRAISNIVRPQYDKNKPIGEYYNLAIGYKFEPGTILGAAPLISYLKYDRSVDLSQNVDSLFVFSKALKSICESEPSQIGANHDYTYVRSLIQNFPQDKLSIIEGVSQAQSYVLAGLACIYYGTLDLYVKDMADLLLIEDLAFEIRERGGGQPNIIMPKNSDNYNHFLVSLGSGYGISMTPLQILSFYNIIANGGVKVKPYIIDASLSASGVSNRHVHREGEPVLDSTIVSKVDSIMRYAVVSGNSGIQGNAKEEMSGLAGHSLQYLDGRDRDGGLGGYITSDGRSRWNSSFVGYFPASDPRYSIICTIVTYKTDKQYPGNDIPAKIVSDIYNSL